VRRRVLVLGTVAGLGAAVLAMPSGSGGAAQRAPGTSGSSTTTTAAATTTTTVPSASCPWAAPSALSAHAPEQLANEVIAQMTVGEKLGIVDLGSANGYENIDTGVPRLCIPSLTLQDGPAGLAAGDSGVTQLPAPIGLAATFDPLLATRYGRVLGSEARGQGIDAVQAPNLNLVRVPESGRSFETFGEDPFLASTLGATEVRGIQSQGTMADIKHYGAYTQETDRQSLDQQVSARALAEVYDAPFQAAITNGGAASVMCAYGDINGTPTCQDLSTLNSLKRNRSFSGFVRSDLAAVSNPVAAFLAGLDMIKPAATGDLANAVAKGQLPMSRLDDAVRRVLTEEFAFGMITKPASGAVGDDVITSQHTEVALEVAEQSIVLLKDAASVLPLQRSSRPSIAVIGTDADADAATTGGGGAQVNAPFTVTPLQALQNDLGSGHVLYDPALPTTSATPIFISGAPAPAATSTSTATSTTSTPGSTSTTQPPTTTMPTTTTASTTTASTTTTSTTTATSDRLRSSTTSGMPAGSSGIPAGSSGIPAGSSGIPAGSSGMAADAASAQVSRPAQVAVTPADETATSPLSGPGWQSATTTFTAPATGLYEVSLSSYGDAFLSLNGSPLVSADGIENWQQPETETATLQLQAGETGSYTLDWFSQVPGEPDVSVQDVSGAIDSAVAAAQQVSVPVVFARDEETEGEDRQSLSLPGYQDALISAVAAANPRTVVVLNTGGAVLTPWLSQVAGLLEAWYPGEEDGNAIAGVLLGRIDPSGRLPVTFPVTQGDQPLSWPDAWPGSNGTVDFSEGLDIGYRGYLAEGLKMRFPFGFGLSYTNFSLSDLSVTAVPGGERATVLVRNVGQRAGRETVEAYLRFPSSAGEPPEQLVAFGGANLAAGAQATVTLNLPERVFEADLSGSWTTVGGSYELSVGTSSARLTLHDVLSAPS
jgi:beta-glucosidase